MEIAWATKTARAALVLKKEEHEIILSVSYYHHLIISTSAIKYIFVECSQLLHHVLFYF